MLTVHILINWQHIFNKVLFFIFYSISVNANLLYGFVMAVKTEQKCVFVCASECVLHSNTSRTAAAAATLGLLESHKSLLFLKEQQMKKAVYDSAWWRGVGHCFLCVGVCVLLIHSGSFLVVCPWVCVFLHRCLVCFETSLSGFSVACTGAGVCVWPPGRLALARSHSIIPLECLALVLSA